jgi:hypothetical protein
MQKEAPTKPFTLLLTRYCDASGMKLNAIAAAAFISYNYLHLLLTETRNPSEQVVYNLARALRLSPEQTGELLAEAGYTPSAALLATSSEQPGAVPIPLMEDSRAARLAQRCYRLSREIPESLQQAFLDEMGRLLDYARYKFLLCGGIPLADLRFSGSQANLTSLDDIATLVAELWGEFGERGGSSRAEETSAQSSPQVADMLESIDQLTGSILAGELSGALYQPRLLEQIREVLRLGVPWEIRRRITESLPGLCKLDAPGACQVLESLRLDRDDKYRVDIRRRVVETLVTLFDYDAHSILLPRIIELLRPQLGDEIYVALATMETCGDILSRLRQGQKRMAEETSKGNSLARLLPAEQAEISKIQRQLLVMWEGPELECLQYSLALHDQLCAPEAMVLSIKEGLQSDDKIMQLVAARYLERLLPLKPMETLQVYQFVLQGATSRNVRRTVARATPSLLYCMNESSLPIRTMARTILITLAQDSDIHIRRTVSDYAMRLFHLDREFLLTLLRHLYQDRDPAIRHRLQPVALRLAQVWLLWYAETAGLVHTTRGKTATPFGE